MSVKVTTTSGAQFEFESGVSSSQIRSRIRKKDVEAKSIDLQDNDVQLTNNTTKKQINDDEALDEESTINASFSRYPYLINILLNDNKWYLIAIWGIIGSLWIACWAQLSFNLPQWWLNAVDSEAPVPITFQTFAIMVLGSLMGWKNSICSGILYYIEIGFGLPFAAEQDGGYKVLIYSNGGYLIGFIIALFQVGYMAEKGWDRQIKTTVLMMIIGNFIIYCFGLIWLPFGIALENKISVYDAVCGFEHGCVGNVLMWGMVPFLLGDTIKIVLATIVLKIMWRSVSWVSTRRSYDPLSNELNNANNA